MRCGKVAPLLCPNRKLRKHELRSSFLISLSVILVVTFYMTAQLLKRFNTCTAKTAASKLSDAAVYSFNKWTRVNRARRNRWVIPTRPLQNHLKQVWLGDLAGTIYIIWIIGCTSAIRFLLPRCCHGWAKQHMLFEHFLSIFACVFGFRFANLGVISTA